MMGLGLPPLRRRVTVVMMMMMMMAFLVGDAGVLAGGIRGYIAHN